MASKKNRITKLMNTNCNALLTFKVPKNNPNVKIPHMNKYAAIAKLSVVVTNPSLSNMINNTLEI